MRRCNLFLPVMLLLAAGVEAAPPAGPVVVELFTSQGCSSCPPADALLGELSHRPDVLALALHVTYWNDLGWKDPFAQAQFDARQRQYAQQLALPSIYTPQMVVNGAQDAVGSQRLAVDRALAQARRPAAIALQEESGLLTLTLPALDHACTCLLTLFAVRTSAMTPVGRGENAGRKLAEFQVVRVMQSLGKWKGDTQALQVDVRRMPDDVTLYALLAQERGTGRVVASGSQLLR